MKSNRFMILLCVACIGIGNTVPVFSDNLLIDASALYGDSFEAIADSSIPYPDNSNNTWRTLYTDKLKEYEASNKYQFALIYLDNDNVPELIVYPKFGSHYDYSILYNVYEGDLYQNDLGGDYGSFAYKEKGNIIFGEHVSNGIGTVTHYSHFLQEGILHPYKAEYDLNEFIGSYDMTFYDITEENILKILNAFLDEKDVMLHGSFYYPGIEEITGYTHDTCSDYYYSDSYFYKDSTEYNPSLSTMSLCLELSSGPSYDSKKWYDPDLTPNNSAFYEDKLKNVKTLFLGNSYLSNPSDSVSTPNGFNGIGFSDFKANKAWESQPTADSIGVCAAKKRIKVPTENNKEYTLIALVVRGVAYEAEWASNFTVGETGAHVGFAKARDDVLAFYDSYYNSLDESEKDNIKLWITGFSRGGITANMVAGTIDEGIALKQEYTYLDPKNLYCYTFEAPQGIQKSILKSMVSDYSNIHNIVNVNDIVPMVAPSIWGFTRYGYDKWLPSEIEDGEYFQAKKDAMLQQLDFMGFTDYANNGLIINDKFQSKDINSQKLVETLALASVGIVISQLLDPNELIQESDDVITHEAMMEGIDLLFGVCLKGRENYYHEYQDTVRNMFVAIDSILYDNPELLKNYLDVFAIESIEYILQPAFAFNPTYTTQQRIADVEKRAIEKISSWNIPGEACKLLSQICINVFVQSAKDIIIHHDFVSLNTIIHFADALGNNVGVRPHYPEISLAWLRSLDHNYNPSAVPEAMSDKCVYNRIHVSSDDVKINIRDAANNLIETIQTAKDTIEDSIIRYSVKKGETCVYLPTDQNYTLDIVSDTNETVNVSIDKYDILNAEVLEKSIFTDVPSSSNNPVEVSLTKIEDANAKSKNTVSVSDQKVQASDVIVPDENTEPIMIDLAQEGNGGVIMGGGTYDKGEFVTVYAATLPKAEFMGWYSDDELITTDNDYSFIAQEEINLTAKFNDIEFYALDFAEAEHGSIQTMADSFPAGYHISLVAKADEGYEFVEWKSTGGEIDDSSKNEAIIIMPNTQVIVSAVFRKIDEPSGIIASGECGAKSENLTWTLDSNGTLTISGKGAMAYWGSSSDVPWYRYRGDILNVKIENGVTSIGGSAFGDCDNLTSITIPDSVTRIENRVFYNCSSLTSITIPDSVTSIGYSAFADCESLTSITIPDSVTSIGYSAFADCESLTSITIPDSVTRIENRVFYNCSSLTAIDVDANNQYYASEDGVLLNKNKTLLIQYPCGKDNQKYVIPDSVTSIGDGAFQYCDSLTSITIPDSVTSIGTGAFVDCDSLTAIDVDANNQYYASEDGVFFDKNKINLIQYPCGKDNQKYVIPDSVTSIGDDAFYNCDSLTSITIPDSVTSIGDDAFYNCDSLTSITIPDSVTSIGGWAFYNCDSLTSITIPDSVSSIGRLAFYDCTSLTSITFENPECEIYDSEYTISLTATIYGYAGSTAQAYAEKYNRKFVALEENTYTKGNMNDDNQITIEDAQIVLLAYSDILAGGSSTLTPAQMKAADVNEDGIIDVLDAQYILIYYVETVIAGKEITWDSIIVKD